MKTKIKKIGALISMTIYQFLVKANVAFAGNKLEESTLVKGLKNLIQDATKVLLVIIPIAAAVFIGIESLKIKACEDEGEVKPHKKKIRLIIIYAVIGETATVIITTILSYFS